jgi:signal transduction histidine kinase
MTCQSVKDIVHILREQPWAAPCREDAFWEGLYQTLQSVLLPEFLGEVSRQVDAVMEIDPELSEPEILARATEHMVQFLEALSASVRIYDPNTGQMLSYGSYPFREASRATYIPLENTVAGEVVRTQRPYLVPNIFKEERYTDKESVSRRGARSLIAIPFTIPRFFPYERETVGVIQIYFAEEDRAFPPLQIQTAELMARRLSFVMARKKILSLYWINEKKEAISRKVFQKIGSRGGIKMKEVFNRVIPEIADIINVQSCALFSVSPDQEYVVLEAGYPEQKGYHGIGKTFSVKSEPAFELVLGREVAYGDFDYEVVTPSYVLIVDPQKSEKISSNLKRLAAARNINSILYVPLKSEEEITHFLTFDALDQRKRYSEWEIEIFLFLGRELMHAQRMEQLDDTLHDFKNPAIAIAGFARRLKNLLEKEPVLQEKTAIRNYLDILVNETTRLQEMALSIHRSGQEEVVDLSGVVQRRFEINKEAIREMFKANVELKEGPYQEPLPVRCYPIQLERILDNLLNNATKAIPLKGGVLSARTYADEGWACAEISNTGQIPEEERKKLLEGGGEGRGGYITYRLIRLMNGRLEVKVEKDSTTTIVRFPIAAA